MGMFASTTRRHHASLTSVLCLLVLTVPLFAQTTPQRQIVSELSLCVEVAGASQDDGASIFQGDCNDGNKHQVFDFIPAPGTDSGFHRIRASHSNKCLGVADGALAPGAEVVQLSCVDNNPSTLWKQRDGALILQHSGYCLSVDVSSRSTSGAFMVQWFCDSPSVKWQVKSVSEQHDGLQQLSKRGNSVGKSQSGFYLSTGTPHDNQFLTKGIQARMLADVPTASPKLSTEPRIARAIDVSTIVSEGLSGLCVDIIDGSEMDGAQAIQASCNGGASQEYQFLIVGEGQFQVVASHSQKCLGVADFDVTESANIIQLPCTNNTLWYVVGDSAYLQLRVLHSAKCLSIFGASIASGAKLVQKACNEGLDQRWSVADGLFVVETLKPSTSAAPSPSPSVSFEPTRAGAGKGPPAPTIQPIDVPSSMPALRGSRSPSRRPSQAVGVSPGPPLFYLNTGTDQDLEYISGGAVAPGFVPSSSAEPTVAPEPNPWEGEYAMSLVAVAAANLDDGRILAWSAWSRTDYARSVGKTFISIFDPSTNESTEGEITNTNHDMFCPGTATLGDGRIMITGGSSAASVTFFDPSANNWYRGPPMNIPRGYHSMTVLGDGSVFTLGGSWSGGRRGNRGGEVWSPSGGWVLKTNILIPGSSTLLTNDRGGIFRSDNHMWLFTAPNGKVFHAGPSQRMHWIDIAGEGEISDSLLRGNDNDAMNGNAVMFDIGKIFTVGGAPNYEYGDNEGTKLAHVIDINAGEGSETVERVGDMAFARTLANSVGLPSGEVIVVGGQTRVFLFTDREAVFAAEIWSPITGQFTTLAEMKIPRTYHSVAILMKDGRVWAAGGGLCGNCPTNHQDAEILTPPYLLNGDGSLKTRPVIESSPSRIVPGETITVSVDRSGSHNFVLMRISAVTHSVNNDQRRIPLTIVGGDNNSFQLIAPDNYNVTVPGTYFLFAMNADGVPSVGKTIVVDAPDGPVPEPSLIFPIESADFSGLCVNIASNSFENGAQATQWTCNENANQQFEFQFVEGGLYRIVAFHSQKCLTVTQGSISEGENIVQEPCDDVPHQLWTVTGSGSGQELKASHSNKCLSIFESSMATGARLVQLECTEGPAQLWQIDDRLTLSEVEAPSPFRPPSLAPSVSPAPVAALASPSLTPSLFPFSLPSTTPSRSPAFERSPTPSTTPSNSPSLQLSEEPSASPLVAQSRSPSTVPSLSPSSRPESSIRPSEGPSSTPSYGPVSPPSTTPSRSPAREPSRVPSTTPSSSPSALPSTTQITTGVPTTATPGEAWTIQSSAANNNWTAVIYGNGTFVAVAATGIGDRVMTSPYGTTWTIRASAADNDWNGLTYGDGIFVAVASTGLGNRVMTSPDGIAWASRPSAADNNWTAVAYGNGIFVAVAASGIGNRIMTSRDGTTWTLRGNAVDNEWRSVTYAEGTFVAVASTGIGNRVMTSPDGIQWTIQTSAADNWWSAVTYGDGTFVAVAATGTGDRVMTSPDGITWTTQTSAPDIDWRSVTYGDGIFVAVASTSIGNRVMTSPDGITWTTQGSANDNDWHSVTYGNTTFVAVSKTGIGNRVMSSG
ncbi:predicted protein [Phaeodactylum tricornutum CCAP 1055/1]|uniref:Ricin B lectin domain-containing protein n=2 Tax=Phaeodactylum tricornutum TaxID=2850 RepID=B7G6L2_PHATC|nr:predicted protein [Phaeodactylum tricornutum CCAP 1055/1]EEC46036.1 predicted protein [Phaeodactylum tricornutum CCAP 1055/1]|eukprot:XP_002182749.1 predicted protein [Phaeodactylum tricornutum CCAP 1055/1]